MLEIKCKGAEAGELDPKIKQFLSAMPSDEGALEGVTIEEIRSAPSAIIKLHPNPASVYVEEIGVPARDGRIIRVRVYRKEQRKSAPPLFFIHGGCWIFCSLDSHDSLCRELCELSGFTVFSIDYRLAPEYKFPVGLNDCYDAISAIDKNRSEYKLTNDEAVVCGDSAGGNLATAVCLMGAQTSGLRFSAQVLIYPICNAHSFETFSYEQFANGHLLTREMMAYASNLYAEIEELSNPLVSPIFSEELETMPKTMILTAEFDILRDEGEHYAEKLSSSGVEVECIRYNGLIHAFACMTGEVELARKALTDITLFLQST